MKKSEIAKRIVELVNESSNNYDAYEDVLELLEQSLPKEKVTKKKSNQVFVAIQEPWNGE